MDIYIHYDVLMSLPFTSENVAIYQDYDIISVDEMGIAHLIQRPPRTSYPAKKKKTHASSLLPRSFKRMNMTGNY